VSITVTYSNHYVWNQQRQNAPQQNRPYAEVVLKGPNGSQRIWCLVDSGADRIQLEQQFANNVGITLPPAQTSVRTSGQSTNVYVVNNVNLEIEGTQITDTCLFGTNSTPILGRVTFLNAFAAGFDKKGWLRT
jgi:predicted aspartyl protease